MKNRNAYIFLVSHNHFDPIWIRTSDEHAEIEENILFKIFRLMDKYPDFKYCLDQVAVLRKFLERNPGMKNTLKKRIEEGRFEIVGGSEVNSDVNLPLGESLVRNIVMGSEWIKKELGSEVVTAALCDVFGMSCQIPQIVKKAGFKWMISGRHGPKGVSYIPSDRFPLVYNWQGPDGSVVISSWGLPVNFSDRNSINEFPKEIAKMTNKGYDIFCLASGEESSPSEYFIEKAHEWQRQGQIQYRLATPKEFFSLLENKVKKQKAELVTFEGEFNPEFTGCYTTRIEVKKRNRELESLLLGTETFAAITAQMGDDCLKERIDTGWRKVIFNQVHDAICGCHTRKVYEEIMKGFADAEKTARGCLNQCFEYLSANLDFSAIKGNPLIVFNPLPFMRTDIIAIDATGNKKIRDHESGKVISSDKDSGKMVFLAHNVPACGYKILDIVPVRKSKSSDRNKTFTEKRCCIENEYYCISAENGVGIYSIVIKEDNWESVRGVTNLIVAEEDCGDYWKESFTGNRIKMTEGKVKVLGVDKREVYERICLEGIFPPLYWLDNSILKWKVEVTLYRKIPRIDFLTRINWEGKNTRVQVRFPTLFTTSRGLYEVPFAVLEREPYDILPMASGDWPCLRFLCVEEAGHGLLLVNHGTPGCHILDGEVRMSLFRSPTKDAFGVKTDTSAMELGEKTFRYSLIPYKGTWKDNLCHRKAQAVNQPLMAKISKKGKGTFPIQMSFLGIEPEDIAFSSLKVSENDNSQLILRVYELYGKKTKARIKSGKKIAKVVETDFQERITKKLQVSQNGVEFEITPYEVKTLLIKFKI